LQISSEKKYSPFPMALGSADLSRNKQKALQQETAYYFGQQES
jgi:hypothetical protein